jgi:hypothetical protein
LKYPTQKSARADKSIVCCNSGKSEASILSKMRGTGVDYEVLARNGSTVRGSSLLWKNDKRRAMGNPTKGQFRPSRRTTPIAFLRVRSCALVTRTPCASGTDGSTQVNRQPQSGQSRGATR